jgi:hypothetical protein
LSTAQLTGTQARRDFRSAGFIQLILLGQRCQMIFFKSARSDVKIHQNLPNRIGQIRQKSARNWDDFRPFFTLRVVFVAFLVRISPYLRSGKGEIFIIFKNVFQDFYFFEIILHLIIFYQLIFLCKKKVINKIFFAYGDPKTARSASKKQTHAKLVKSARNPPEIRSPPEIYFARQTTFKSARILQIWRRKPPSGNAVLGSFS